MESPCEACRGSGERHYEWGGKRGTYDPCSDCNGTGKQGDDVIRDFGMTGEEFAEMVTERVKRLVNG